jgi:signal transduction histidine kinase
VPASQQALASRLICPDTLDSRRHWRPFIVRDDPRSPTRVKLNRLAWAGIWIPILALGALCTSGEGLVTHVGLPPTANTTARLLLFPVVIVGTYLFSRFVFGKVRQQGREMHQLRALAAYLESIGEEERSQLAREIDDGLAQPLAGLKIDLAWAARLTDQQPGLRQTFRAMLSLVDAAIQSVRRIHSELRPGLLDHLGLVAAIEWQTQAFQARTGLPCALVSTPDLDLDRERTTAGFRIFQQALANITLHTGTTRVAIRLEQRDQNVFVTVEDDGTSATEPELAGGESVRVLRMQERALPFGGDVTINRRPGAGTSVTLRMPLQRADVPGSRV